jgi:hypothetical protein
LAASQANFFAHGAQFKDSRIFLTHSGSFQTWWVELPDGGDGHCPRSSQKTNRFRSRKKVIQIVNSENPFLRFFATSVVLIHFWAPPASLASRAGLPAKPPLPAMEMPLHVETPHRGIRIRASGGLGLSAGIPGAYKKGRPFRSGLDLIAI